MKRLPGQRHSGLSKRNILKAVIRGKINVSDADISLRTTFQYTNYKSLGPIMTGEAWGSRKGWRRGSKPSHMGSKSSLQRLTG